MSEENDLPIHVVNLWAENTLIKVVMGEPVGTVIRK
jgi:uridylate kinase